MSSGRIPPWKRARRLSTGRERRRGFGGLEQCDVLVDPWPSEALATAGCFVWGSREKQSVSESERRKSRKR
jgi:hypothetical protein